MLVGHIKALSFHFQNLAAELKILILLRFMILSKCYTDFHFLTKNTDFIKNMQIWVLIVTLIQKLSWCTTTIPNFTFLAYAYPKISMGLVKKWRQPPRAYSDPKHSRPNKVKLFHRLLILWHYDEHYYTR